MAEARLRARADELLDLQPVVMVVADALAVRADRQQTAQLAHVRERLLQFGDARAEHLLETDDTAADADAGAQLVPVERLGDVVVSAALEPGDNAIGRADPSEGR